jgi:hypothetical protein
LEVKVLFVRGDPCVAYEHSGLVRRWQVGRSSSAPAV